MLTPPRKFFQIFSEKVFWPLSQNFHLWRHFGSKNESFSLFSLKMSYFDVFDRFNDILGQYGGPQICSPLLNNV